MQCYKSLLRFQLFFYPKGLQHAIAMHVVSAAPHQSHNMENLCEGSRRPVRGERHRLKMSGSGHMEATCPVCKRRIVVRRIMGIVEFPRHESRK
jgi:hypothetical protein